MTVLCLILPVISGFFPVRSVATLNPIYTEDVLAHDVQIEGVWFLDDANGQSLSITRARDGYRLVFDSRTQSDEFEAKLVMIGNEEFLDVYSVDSWRTDVVHVHNILRVKTRAGALEVQLLDWDKVEEVIDAEGAEHLAVKASGGRTLLLVSKTSDLQRLLEKKQSRVFSEPKIYRRRALGGRRSG